MINDNSYFINSTLIEGVAEDGYITTTGTSQEFYFRDLVRHEQYTLTNIVLECKEDSPHPAKIKLNNLNSYIYIAPGYEETIEDINIIKIISVSDVGTKFRFKGLGSSVSGCYFGI